MKKLLSLSIALFAIVQISTAQSDLVITEIMYNPPEAGTDSLEFIEIYNKGTVAINLNNYTCTGGNYTFPNVSLNAGGYYIIAINPIAFNNVYGFAADGQFSSGLSNGGENIVLKDALGNVMDSVLYDDAGVWPSGSASGRPDGGGASIILCDENSDNNLGSNWLPSVSPIGVTINVYPVLASPGALNFCCVATSGIDPLTACDSLTWTNGITYYANNFTAKDTLVNTAGCDSIVTLDLVVKYSSPGITIDTRTECDSLTWIDGITYYTNNNTASFTATNVTGCDSSVTLDLTIINSTTGTDTRTACDSIIWLDGITYSSNNNTATFNLIGGAANSCDSLVTLDLTIVSIDNTTNLVNQTITSNETSTGVSYRWLDCDNNNVVIPNETSISYTVTTSGTYAVEITSGTCVDTSACVPVITVGINSLSNNNVTLYPNPTKDVLNIILDNISIVDVTLTSIDGKVVYQKNNLNTKTITIDLSDNSKGIYFLRIANGSNYQTYKVIKK